MPGYSLYTDVVIDYTEKAKEVNATIKTIEEKCKNNYELTKEDVHTLIEALENMSDIVAKYGFFLSEAHKSIHNLTYQKYPDLQL